MGVLDSVEFPCRHEAQLFGGTSTGRWPTSLPFSEIHQNADDRAVSGCIKAQVVLTVVG